MTALASLRAQFDGVAVDIADIERAAHTLRAVALLEFSTVDAVGLQISDQFGFVEGFDLQAETVEIVACRVRVPVATARCISLQV